MFFGTLINLKSFSWFTWIFQDDFWYTAIERRLLNCCKMILPHFCSELLHDHFYNRLISKLFAPCCAQPHIEYICACAHTYTIMSKQYLWDLEYDSIRSIFFLALSEPALAKAWSSSPHTVPTGLFLCLSSFPWCLFHPAHPYNTLHPPRAPSFSLWLQKPKANQNKVKTNNNKRKQQ